MATDYRNLKSPESVAPRLGKKNLTRGRKVDLVKESELPRVYENDGFENENGTHTNPTSGESTKDMQFRSKENQRLDFNSQSKTNPIESIELKEKNINVRAIEHEKVSSHGRSLPNIRNNLNVSNQKTVDKSQNNGKPASLNTVHSVKPDMSLERLKSHRPSLTADLVQRGFTPDQPDAASMPFARSQSMRVSSGPPLTNQKPRRRLLRDISFSDSDDVVTKNYGSLGKVPLPRRQSESDAPTQSSIQILLTTMQDLLQRGKVYKVVVIDLETSRIMASLPEADLSNSDANGMVKSLLCSSTIFKINIIGDVYTCFKHNQNAVQGRSGDLVMVMQKTTTCLVVGFSNEDAPGACQSEVMEFAQVLERADW